MSKISPEQNEFLWNRNVSWLKSKNFDSFYLCKKRDGRNGFIFPLQKKRLKEEKTVRFGFGNLHKIQDVFISENTKILHYKLKSNWYLLNTGRSEHELRQKKDFSSQLGQSRQYNLRSIFDWQTASDTRQVLYWILEILHARFVSFYPLFLCFKLLTLFWLRINLHVSNKRQLFFNSDVKDVNIDRSSWNFTCLIHVYVPSRICKIWFLDILINELIKQ